MTDDRPRSVKLIASPAQIIPRLLRVEDVARYINATTWFVEELIRNNQIRFLILGKRRVIDVHDLDAWIEEQKIKQEAARKQEEEDRKNGVVRMEARVASFSMEGVGRDADGSYTVVLELNY